MSGHDMLVGLVHVGEGISLSDGAMTRAIASSGPPAANGTTMVSGRLGQSCAATCPVSAKKSEATANALCMSLTSGRVVIPGRRSAGKFTQPA
jgi:hypothetical protein